MGERSGDLTGQRFGQLTVLEEAARKNGTRRWLCRCDCGTEKIVYGSALKRGSTKSCGCMGRGRKREWAKNGLPKRNKELRTRPTTLCVSCIRSAAPPELQCIWDASKAKKLPQGAAVKYVEKKSDGGAEYTYVISCPEYLSIQDANNQKILKEARKKNIAMMALEQAEKLGCMGGSMLLSELAGEL